MTLKKFFCAVTAVVMLFALTACKSGGGKASDLDIKINGVTVTAPFTVENLGSDFSIENANFTINYKGEIVAGVIFDSGSTESDFSKKKITRLMSVTDGGAKSVSVNGIITGSTQSEVLKAIGKPAFKEEALAGWVYHEDGKPEDDNYLLITFDKDDKVSWIAVKPE